jgi:hypothetical protein
VRCGAGNFATKMKHLKSHNPSHRVQNCRDSLCFDRAWNARQIITFELDPVK